MFSFSFNFPLADSHLAMDRSLFAINHSILRISQRGARKAPLATVSAEGLPRDRIGPRTALRNSMLACGSSELL
ncbi:hypothetical protein AMJ85_04195 [candidate division BRC1 bacterium SM23_51]|nr:MAG: hypothetical protein AMJ85_04195 [candidate division BRC1 bacterium SM23_51]